MCLYHNYYVLCHSYCCCYYYYSGWWFGTFFIFTYIGNVIIPTDELIFFRRVGQPPTSIGIIIT